LNTILFHDDCDGYLNTGSMKRAVRRRDTCERLARSSERSQIFSQSTTLIVDRTPALRIASGISQR
jgi:hypothetical protein